MATPPAGEKANTAGRSDDAESEPDRLTASANDGDKGEAVVKSSSSSEHNVVDSSYTYAESDFVEDVLSNTLTAEKILAVNDRTLLRYALLILSQIGQLGSLAATSPGDATPSTTSTTSSSLAGRGGGDSRGSVTAPRFASLLRAYAVRCATSRPLKLRTALLTHVASDLLGIGPTSTSTSTSSATADDGATDGREQFWTSVVVHDPNCYDEANVAELAAGLVPLSRTTSLMESGSGEEGMEAELTASSIATSAAGGGVVVSGSGAGGDGDGDLRVSIATVTTDHLLSSDHHLTEYTARRFFHPRSGIALKTKRRGLRTYSHAFSEYAALLFLMQDLSIPERSTASAVGSRMVELKLIKRVSTTTTLVGHTGAAFGFGRNVYVRCAPPPPPSKSFRALSVENSPTAAAALHSSNEATTGAAGIEVTFGLDVIDMQSVKFWRDVVWAQPLSEGTDYGTYAVVHPMAVSDGGADAAAGAANDDADLAVVLADANSYGGYVVHTVEVKKVFSSMAKPGILALSSYPPGSVILPPQQAAMSRVEIGPRVVAKTGDNLINDTAVELMFGVFSHVWRSDLDRFGDPDKAPYSFVYDVLPTGPRAGLLEFVPGIKPLNDYDWAAWTVANTHASPDVLDDMVRSAAGCSVATYVLGCGDRHWDNIQIRDGSTMLHIDFGMILGENPAFKTPRFSISAAMERAFRDVGIWERFVDMCGTAFLSLRARSSELTRLVALVLYHAGRPRTKILKYMASRESFNIAEADDAAASKFVTDQVRESSHHWETILRKFTHDRVDPLFFRMVEMAPSGLVSAVEKMYDKS